MKITDLIDSFLTLVMLRLTPGTHEHYASHFKHLIRWCETQNITRVKQISAKVISEYIFHMKKTCSNRTINMRIGNLQRCYDQMGIKFEFLQSVPMLKQRLVTYDFIDLPKLREMRKHLFSLPETITNIYQAAIILVLMDTGCRKNELINIQKKNVDLKNFSIKFETTKGQIDREVPFKEKTALVIQKLLDLKHDHKFLFHNEIRNRPMNKWDIETTFRKYKEIFEMDCFHPHMLRHSFCTHLIEAGVDRKIVQALSGHKDGKSLDRYVHVRKSFVQQMYKEKFILDD